MKRGGILWGCQGFLRPTKQPYNQKISDLRVGGSFLVLADDNGHLLQTDG
jgi:hypothetical protein